MAKGEKPKYRIFIVREGETNLKDEKGKPIKAEKTNDATFINLGGLWAKEGREGKYSGAFKPSVKTVAGEYVELSELTLKNGEFLNLQVVE